MYNLKRIYTTEEITKGNKTFFACIEKINQFKPRTYSRHVAALCGHLGCG